MATRNGGDLVVETLTALGVTTVFGIPGQHALGLFDALSRSDLHFVSSRVENNAAFAADGYARATGRPGVLLLSTGPGALTSLAGLQEALATGVPMVVISSQIPRAGLGERHRGMLHQLDDQKSSVANVTVSRRLVQHASAIPSAVAAAWEDATSAPMGPAWIEVPQDILLGSAEHVPPVAAGFPVRPRTPEPRGELLDAAARLLRQAKRPAVIAGGGVRRAGAEAELLALAELAGAPVVCAPGGKGAFPWEHPLSLQSWVEDVAVSELLEEADVLLAVGTSLGEVTSNYFTLSPRGSVIHVDAETRVLEANHLALGIHADAKLALAGLAQRLEKSPRGVEPNWDGFTAQELTAGTLKTVAQRLDSQGLEHERAFMDAVRAGTPDGAQTFWDMTIAAYWGWSCWDARSGQFHSAQGAGGLGYGFPAALGAAAGLAEDPDAGASARVLAVAGDGSSMYSIAELATAVQHQLNVTWLVVDDGGYGILREYMQDAFGKATATELARPDFVALAQSFGVQAKQVEPGDVEAALRQSFQTQGPRLIVVQTLLRMFAPTHLERESTLPTE
ncbi:thiamine pyrophosphate-binding protein [Galactobacter caseinivorans]|uniref:Thiamine pyrophosphate-binding protein n=1 Tax=Galactobacter caseinivorans TaxID=2676123 RepID=A0A496PFQ2_9MICC|nr:thiamine pyrophosphate-binding protein [Galactobacter caseinivorans]RKW69551.1 thiamine pyrophosphate-binding protein [Galactobacter caseinivorans]